MSSIRSMACCYLLILCIAVEGLPRYRRQGLGQSALEQSLNAARTGSWSHNIQASGSMNNFKNYQYGGQIGVGIPIYNRGYNKPSVGLGAAMSGGHASYNGQRFAAKPEWGVGVGVKIPFGRG